MLFFKRNWFPLFFIPGSSFFSVIHANVDFKIKLLLFFVSKSPGGYAIYCRNARVLEMQNFTPAYMNRRTEDFLRTQISWMHSLPNFLTHGAPLRALRARELR